MTLGITLDTGALIALSKKDGRMRALWTAYTADLGSLTITVPAAVVVEWYRSDSRMNGSILDAVIVERLTKDLAKVAGKAIAAVSGATAVDAIVVASAASRGDVIYTSDYGDIDRLRREYFPGVANVIRI